MDQTFCFVYHMLNWSTTAIIEHCLQDIVQLVCNNVLVWGMCQSKIQMTCRTKQNIAKTITLPQPACLLLTVHLGAITSTGRLSVYTHTWLSTWCKKKKKKHDSLDQATFVHCSVVQFCCSYVYWRCFQWTGVSMGYLTALWLWSSHTRLK